MTWSRALGVLTAVLVVAGCAVVAIGMANAAGRPHHRKRASAVPTSTPRPAYLPLTVSPLPKPTRSSTTVAPSASSAPSSAPTTLRPSAAPLTTASHAARSARTTPAKPRVRTAHAWVRPATLAVSRVPGGNLPLRLRTHHARQVITVVARSRRSTVATVQAWRKVRGGGWVRRGARIHAHIGADGMSWHPSESKSATPRGSFTLTHAFGRRADPGTALPYLHTNPADWWISQAGPLYNTHQRCWSHCPFTQGAPNEHLYYETPYYNYAVVIDYNTRNAPGGVRQGAGSAFFLHVHPAGTGATAGCVAIPRARLVSIMRWLAPRKHPRILIGVG